MKGGACRVWWASCVLAVVIALGGCAEKMLPVGASKQVGRTDPPAPQGIYKVGEPYQINGTWYYPGEDYGYAEAGIASFYGGETRGTNFHGRYSANGEIYDMNALTAAHQTLPMPSLVRVTNLENGRAIVLRINDRGPFVRGRIIDVSRRAAQLLGFEAQGTARVRVEILSEESRALKAAMLGGPGTPSDMVSVAAAPRAAVASDALPPPPGSRAAESVASEALPPPSSTLPPAPTDAAPKNARARGAAQMAARPAPPVIAEPAPQIASVAPVSRRAPTAAGAEVAALPVPQQVISTPIVTQGPVRPTSIYIQAGAFSNYDNAYRLSVRLSRYGRTNVSPISSGVQQLYRVRVGPVNTVHDADALLVEMASLVPQARIVVD